MPFGPDTYKIWAAGGMDGAPDRYAINEAIKYCESLGKHFMPVQAEYTGAYHLIFSCLDADDPALKRPEKGAETILERKGGGVILMTPLPAPPK